MGEKASSDRLEGITDLTPKDRDKLPLVGREEILEELKGRLDEAVEGRSQYVLVQGEAGIGKSRLIRTVIDICGEKECAILRSRCTFGAVGEPFQPIREALGEHLADAGDKGATALTSVAPMGMIGMGMAGAGMGAGSAEEGPKEAGEGKGNAANGETDKEEENNAPVGLLPMGAAGSLDTGEVRDTLKVLDDSTVARGRDRIFDQVTEVLEELSVRSPVVMILEDLQWAPAGTLQLLRHMMRTVSTQRFLFIGTSRSEEFAGDTGEERPPFYAFIEEPETQETLKVLSLKRLDRDQSRELISLLFGGRDPPDHFVDWIQENTDGNPLFIEEIIDNLTSEGLIDQSNFRWFRELDISDIHMPSSLKEVVLRRIRNLDPMSRKVLQIASVLGRLFDFRVLEQVAENTEDELFDALDQLLEEKLIFEDSQSEQEIYRFDNVIIQEMAYSELNRSRKRRLHSRAGEVIEMLYRDNIAAAVYDLARHFYKGQNYERSAYYLLRAGSYTTELFAFHEAAGYYRQGLDALEHLPRTKDNLQMKMEVINRLGNISILGGEWKDSLEYNTQLIELAREMEDVLRLAEGHRHIAEIHRQRGLWDKAVEHYQKALEISSGIGELFGIFEAQKGLGHVHWRMGEMDQAIGHFKTILSSAEEIHDYFMVASVYIDLGNVYNYQDQYDKARQYYQDAIDTLEEMGEQSELARAYNNLGDVLMKLEQWDKALECFSSSREYAEGSGNLLMAAWSKFNAAECHLYKGDTASARTLCDEAYPDLEKLDNKVGMGAVHRIRGMTAFEEGDIEAGDMHFGRAMDIYGSLKSPAEEGETHFQQARYLMKAGLNDRATAAFRSAEKLFSKIGASTRLASVKEALETLQGAQGPAP
jgi:predicted ATPase